MSGSHSEVQHTRTTVVWPWRTLVNAILPCSAWLTQLIVATWLIQVLTGFFLMELEYPALISGGISTEPEVRWQYSYIVEELEWRGSTTVRYLIHWMFSRPSTLECTQQTPIQVSDNKLICRFTTVTVCKYMRLPTFAFLNISHAKKTYQALSLSVLQEAESCIRLEKMDIAGETDIKSCTLT